MKKLLAITVAAPAPGVIAKLADAVTERGGRVMTEPHADRSTTMEFPVEGSPGTKIQKQQDRCECRRRAVMAVPTKAGDPVRLCAICDSLYVMPLGKELLGA